MTFEINNDRLLDGSCSSSISIALVNCNQVRRKSVIKEGPAAFFYSNHDETTVKSLEHHLIINIEHVYFLHCRQHRFSFLPLSIEDSSVLYLSWPEHNPEPTKQVNCRSLPFENHERVVLWTSIGFFWWELREWTCDKCFAIASNALENSSLRTISDASSTDITW